MKFYGYFYLVIYCAVLVHCAKYESCIDLDEREVIIKFRYLINFLQYSITPCVKSISPRYNLINSILKKSRRVSAG